MLVTWLRNVAPRWPTARTFRRGEAATHSPAVLPPCGSAGKPIGGEQSFGSRRAPPIDRSGEAGGGASKAADRKKPANQAERRRAGKGVRKVG
jgi:hypothetical protein